MNFVRQIDSDTIIKDETDEWGSYKLGAKYENSKYAIAYGSTILTEFIYDRPDNLSDVLSYKNAIPVSRDGKWGFINTSGNIIVPFIFDHAVSSDGGTAFVKINGRYGIINVPAAVYNRERELPAAALSTAKAVSDDLVLGTWMFIS